MLWRCVKNDWRHIWKFCLVKVTLESFIYVFIYFHIKANHSTWIYKKQNWWHYFEALGCSFASFLKLIGTRVQGRGSCSKRLWQKDTIEEAFKGLVTLQLDWADAQTRYSNWKRLKRWILGPRRASRSTEAPPRPVWLLQIHGATQASSTYCEAAVFQTAVLIIDMSVICSSIASSAIFLEVEGLCGPTEECFVAEFLSGGLCE